MTDRAAPLGEPIECAVAYAAPALQFCIVLRLPAGSTAADARDAARLQLAATSATQAAQVPWAEADCGIFGQACGWAQRLEPGDRVELYRPLQVDPRQSRRNRAQAAQRDKGARR
jgi:putative ubiquitin-RnfH superfamily antitoxin RatB of RatAB toxin-antitoxin module